MTTLKKYLYLSISANVLLVVLYFGWFHHKKVFSFYEGVRETLHIANVEMEESKKTEHSINESYLFRKPKMKVVFSDFFSEMDSLREDFFIKADNCAKGLLPLDSLQKEQTRTKEAIAASYAFHLDAIKQEAKLPAKEVELKIENFKANTWRDNPLDTLLSIPQTGKIAMIEALKQQVRSVEIQGVSSFNGMLGFRGLRLDRYFPVFRTRKGTIKLGERLEGELLIAGFAVFPIIANMKFYLNGKEVEGSPSAKREVELPTHQIGKHKIEAVTVWTYPRNKHEYRDTTYFEYEVTH